MSVGKQPSVCLLRFLSVGGIDKSLLRDYLPLVSLNKALVGAYFMGGMALGGSP